MKRYANHSLILFYTNVNEEKMVNLSLELSTDYVNFNISSHPSHINVTN